MRKIKIGNKQVGEGEQTFIIAEAGSNHNGKLEQAKKLIGVAADAGVDAVKFQLFRAERIYPKNCGVVDTAMGKVDFFKVLKNMELPLTWLEILREYSEKKELIFLCSCFDEESADALENVGITAHKLGSPELNHIPLLEHLAKKKKTIILSTGLSKLGEIEEAVDTCYERMNEQVILLHCVSAYPTPLEDCNLNVIKTLKLAFDVPVGFSDHTLDPIIAPVTAVAIGANVIEKHFTISKKLEGPDHSFALDPSELKTMVEEIRKVEKVEDKLTSVRELFGKEKTDTILGNYKKMIVPSEKDIYPNDKRSIHAVQNIKRGDMLTKENIMVLRSERNLNPGIHPRYYKLILGKKVSRDISYGEGVQLNDLLSNGDIMNNKIVAIIQARTGSTRLPRKVLMSIGEKTILEWVIERIKKASLIDNVVVATSTKEQDDIIEKLCKKSNIRCFRGSEEDVLSRYYEASKQMEADIIVRITSDCPFIDPQIIDEIIRNHLENKNDYTTNDTENSYPKGTDVEVFNFECLEEAYFNANKTSQREHVTPYLYEHPEIFKIETIKAESSLRRPKYRFCIDTKEDLKLTREVYARLSKSKEMFDTSDIINLLDSHPELCEINAHIRQKKFWE